MRLAEKVEMKMVEGCGGEVCFLLTGKIYKAGYTHTKDTDMTLETGLGPWCSRVPVGGGVLLKCPREAHGFWGYSAR